MNYTNYKDGYTAFAIPISITFHKMIGGIRTMILLKKLKDDMNNCSTTAHVDRSHVNNSDNIPRSRLPVFKSYLQLIGKLFIQQNDYRHHLRLYHELKSTISLESFADRSRLFSLANKLNSIVNGMKDSLGRCLWCAEIGDFLQLDYDTYANHIKRIVNSYKELLQEYLEVDNLQMISETINHIREIEDLNREVLANLNRG